MRRMYATAPTYESGAPYSSGRIMEPSSYYSPSYSRSSSFDGAIFTGRMYGGSTYGIPSAGRPISRLPATSEQRPLRISSSYGDSGGSIFAPTPFVGNSSHYGRYTAKPPLPKSSGYGNSYSSGYRSGGDIYSTSEASTLRYPRSASVDRGGSPMTYIPMDSRSRYDEEVRAIPGQVHNITTRFERLSPLRQRSDSFGRSPLVDRGTPFRDLSSDNSFLVNGYGRSPQTRKEDSSETRRRYGGLRQRRASESSEDSSSESRDAVGALPANGGYRIYRNQTAASSMPDVPSCSESKGKDSSSEHFARNDPVRNSSSSQESGSSTSSSGTRLTARERRRLPPPDVTDKSDSSGRSSPENLGKAGILGLQNIGNTCLSHTKPLRDYCLKACSTDINNNNSRMKGALIKAFWDLLSQLWSTSRATYIIPDYFKGQIQKFAPRFVGYSQQDAQEFLRYVLQGLHEDVNRVRSKAPALPPLDDSLPDSQKAAESWKRYLRVDDSKIVDIFVGQLKSELKCTSCGHVSTTFDPFWDLSLPIPQSSRYSDVSLSHCLDAFTREEVLDGDEKPKCEKCKTRRKCTKKFSVHRFPKILVLHLKRFSGERFRSRLSTLVEFPVKNLDMKKYSSGHCNGSCLYSLYALSNHSGTPLMGHYTAYAKHALSGKWHFFDDGRVSNAENRSVVGSEAYVLFYEIQDGGV